MKLFSYKLLAFHYVSAIVGQLVIIFKYFVNGSPTIELTA
jgi:hypothetical protein